MSNAFNIALVWSCIILIIKGIWHMKVGGEANYEAMKWLWITAAFSLTVFHVVVTNKNKRT
tara:strand:- start:1288 stop:1470 length:183 start_codon:yes stop_codon:yes gene_type:complete